MTRDAPAPGPVVGADAPLTAHPPPPPMLPRRAMVLAAGLGKRMRPLTNDRPKPMVMVGGRTLVDRTLDNLARSGVETAVVNLHYFADKLEAHLKARTGPPALVLSDERDALLETGGGVKRALPLLGEDPFIVCNSDVLWLDGPERALHRMARAWDDSAMDALLLTARTATAFGYEGAGDVTMDPLGRLTRRAEGRVAPLLYGGVMIVHPRLFAHAPEGAFSFNVLFDHALAEERLFGLVHDGEWCHVGTPEGVREVEAYLREWPWAVDRRFL